MGVQRGYFDETAVPDGWFDETQQSVGWWDADLLDVAASGVTGTVAVTNADDTSAASGSPVIAGTSATTNANDTPSASGTVGGSVTGTVAVTNANDAAAASGWAGSVTGTVAVTNANDTATATGTAGGAETWGGAKFQYPNWQPYILAKRDWEPKVPAQVAQVIERIARTDKTPQRALAELEYELEQVEDLARYQRLLVALMESQFNSLQALRRQQLARIARQEQDAEDEEALLLLG